MHYLRLSHWSAVSELALSRCAGCITIHIICLGDTGPIILLLLLAIHFCEEIIRLTVLSQQGYSVSVLLTG